jgi:hypothetical protein
VTNIKAQLYCQKWGLEKLTNLFNKIAYRQMIAALEKWSEFVDYQNNQDKAENYMKWKGSRRLVKMLEDFDTKQKAGGWDKWVHVIMHQRKREQNKSATDIERVARGFMGRRRVLNICTLETTIAAIACCVLALWAALCAVFCVLLCTTSQACTNIPNILDTLCLDLYSYCILFFLSPLNLGCTLLSPRYWAGRH